jgi:hypothetical protein
MGACRRGGSHLRRCRTPLVIAFVVPALFLAFATKAARAAVYKSLPILCDGVDDDADVPILLALPAETTKESFPTKLGPQFLGKCFDSLTSRCHLTGMEDERRASFGGLPLRAKRLFQRQILSDNDPDVH